MKATRTRTIARKLLTGVIAAGLITATGSAAMARAATPEAYIDNRSSPTDLVYSLYNAINRHEYARAYSYWGPNADVAPYDQFVNGYKDTKHVDLVLAGKAQAEGAAGSTYYTLAVAIDATHTDGTHAVYAGCYLMRLAQPTIQEPPFTPLHIEKGRLKPTDGPLAGAVPKDCTFQ